MERRTDFTSMRTAVSDGTSNRGVTGSLARPDASFGGNSSGQNSGSGARFFSWSTRGKRIRLVGRVYWRLRLGIFPCWERRMALVWFARAPLLFRR